MFVSIYAETDFEDVADDIGAIAAVCYGGNASDFDKNVKRAKTCADRGHMSVFEHYNVTFLIEGISRACANQIVRHRLASYTQESMRYVKIDTCAEDAMDNEKWYVYPKELFCTSALLNDKRAYEECMNRCAETYIRLIDSGIKPEDARFALPLSTKTNLYMTMNLREIMHFNKLRNSKNAQWEIRDVARKMMKELYDLRPELRDLYLVGE